LNTEYFTPVILSPIISPFSSCSIKIYFACPRFTALRPGKRKNKSRTKRVIHPNEDTHQAERGGSSTRTKMVIKPNEDSHRPERSGVSGQKNQLFGKICSSKPDAGS
jgi:hypothetical protein